MARKYHVEGTKTFLIWSVVLLLLGLWAVKDGWFPSASTLIKHSLTEDKGFYLFNKSLAVMSLVGSTVCGYIHLLVR